MALGVRVSRCVCVSYCLSVRRTAIDSLRSDVRVRCSGLFTVLTKHAITITIIIITPPPVGGRGIVFDRFVSLFLRFFVSNITRKRLELIKFWDFLGQFG